MSRAAASETSLAQLERWFLHAPLRFVIAAVALWVVWAVTATALGSMLPLRAERVVVPVLGQNSPARDAFEVLLVAPLLENALLWLVFHAARFFATQWLPARAGAIAVACSASTFALGHWPFKTLYGIEVLAGGWLMSMCFLWGARHGVTARGYWTSVAAHVGVNSVALALFHA